MKPFDLQRATSLDHASQLCVDDEAKPIGGGTNLVDLLKLEVEAPDRIVDINKLPLAGIDTLDDGGLRVGALASNTAVAVDDRIRRDWPVLSRAILSGATQQIRNRATTAGNLCQRTRCYYFYNIDQPCNKRDPGTGCGAINGIARQHAILGASDQCIATYSGDMAVALSALDAHVEIWSGNGKSRSVPLRAFHRLPGETPWRDNVLAEGEIITAVLLPPPATGKQLYRKVRERSSYAFALVSVAAIVAMADGRIARAELAFGGLAHKPWHDPRIADLLMGQEPDEALFERAADLLLEDAQGHGGNEFKIPLARRTLKAVLGEATGVIV